MSPNKRLQECIKDRINLLIVRREKAVAEVRAGISLRQDQYWALPWWKRWLYPQPSEFCWVDQQDLEVADSYGRNEEASLRAMLAASMAGHPPVMTVEAVELIWGPCHGE